MKKATIWAVVLLIVIGTVYWFTSDGLPNKYEPVVNVEDFTKEINNPYFKVVPGKIFIYQASTTDRVERVEIGLINEKKTVMGIDVAVVREQVWVDGKLVEDTKDWYAEDNEGNVWYFGEDSAEYADGKIVSRDGSWEAGIDGAKPGIIMKANPQVGDIYRQEYLPGEAEDVAKVLSLTEEVSIGDTTFKDCLQTYEYTKLDREAKEHKFYCKENGGLTVIVDLTDNTRFELLQAVPVKAPFVNSLPGAKAIPPKAPYFQPDPKTNRITKEQATAIALWAVPGYVVNVAIEQRFDTTTYVVGIKTSSSKDTVDVTIGARDGKILNIKR